MELKALIETLAQRTQSRGCTEAEEDEAAKKIGRLIMKHGLPGAVQPTQKPAASPNSSWNSTFDQEVWSRVMAEVARRQRHPVNSSPHPFEGLGGRFWKFTT